MKIVVAFVSALALVGCANVAEDAAASVESELNGGCRTVCPKCRRNQPCPRMACYLDCNGPTKCGPGQCGAGQVCCNESCGICTEPTGFCTDQYCEPVSPKRDCSGVLALCIMGFHWSETQCRCVADRKPPAGGCTTDADCRTFSNYCEGCACEALGVNDGDPGCHGTTVQCFVDPCFQSTAVCLGGVCSLASTSTF